MNPENPKSPGELKLEEYVSRINHGESSGDIVNSLEPGSWMRTQLESRLSKNTENPAEENNELVVPSNLRGQPADVLEEMWEVPLTVDNEKNERNSIGRKRIIDKLRFQEEQERQIFDTQRQADEIQIGEIRERLGIEEVSDPTLERQLAHIDKTMGAIAEGARLGFKDNFEEKIASYVERIRKGEPKEKVLEGLPKTMINEVEKRLGTFEKRLTKDDVATILKTLPKIPVTDGSPMKMVDPTILQSRGKQDLNSGDKVYTIGPNGPVFAEVVSKGDKGQIVLKLEDGTIFPTMFLGDTYFVGDLEKLKKSIDGIIM